MDVTTERSRYESDSGRGLGFVTAFVPWLALSTAGADVELIGKSSVPGDASDRSGLSGSYTNPSGESIPADQLGSFGSAVAYSGKDNRYYAVNDRGFGDGTSASVDRFHVFEIEPDAKGKSLKVRLLETHLLTDEAGKRFVGLSSDFGRRFDPEGLRVGRDGSLYIADEYGPSVWQFRPDGRRIRTFNIPSKFLVAHPRAGEDDEIAANTSGRVTNKGMEGLAITPDGRALVGIMQSPLIQDGGRKGVNVRVLKIDLGTNATSEFIYTLDSPKNGVSEILAVDDHRFLVLEREGKGGTTRSSRRSF